MAEFELQTRLKRSTERTSKLVVGLIALPVLLSIVLPRDLVEHVLKIEHWTPLSAALDNAMRVLRAVLDNAEKVALLGATWLWFALFRDAVLRELDLTASLYEEGQFPEFRDLVAPWMYAVLPWIFSAAFIALFFSVARIEIYCWLAIAVSIVDLAASHAGLTNYQKFFVLPALYAEENKDAPRFDLTPDRDQPFVVEALRKKREIMARHYLARPTLLRIVLRTFAFGLVLALVRWLDDGRALGVAERAASILLYGAATLVVLAPEVVIWRWRAQRDAELVAVNRRLAADQREYRKRKAAIAADGEVQQPAAGAPPPSPPRPGKTSRKRSR